MKIAIITSFWNPPLFWGGISRVVYELKRIWTAQGHIVHVYASNTSTDESQGVYRIPIPPVPLSAVLENLYLALTRSLDFYDIIFPQSAYGCLFRNKNKCVPFIHTLSGVEHKVPWRFWRYFHGTIEKIALKKIRKTITLSDDTIRALVNVHHLALASIVKVHNGVDSQAFRPDPLKRHTTFTVFTAGRLIPRKRFDLLIRAFALFIKGHENARLVIAGSGDLEVDLRRLVSDLNLTAKVDFLGFIDNDRMLEFYQSASVFVLPSEAEGMPMVVLEAQSCGLPVLVADFDTARQVIDENRTGFIVRGDNPNDWAEKFALFYDDRGLMGRFGNEGRKRAIEVFSWDAVAAKIMHCFQNL